MNSILAGLLNGMPVSAGLALTVWIVLRLTPGALLNAATRYVVWWVVLVVVAALPLFYLPVSGAASGAVSRVGAAVNRTAPFQAAEGPPSLQIGRFPLPGAEVSASRMVLRRAAFPITIHGGQWPRRIAILWMMTSVLMVIRLFGSVVTLERRKARASDAPAELTERVAEWVAQCEGSGRRIRLAISSEISVPLLAGPWRPSILLPARLLDELSGRELEQIGIHEAAHVVRRDDYALLIQRLVEAVFGLHPVVRWISNRIDLEREIACDDFVIAATGDSQPYAKCLARVVELSGGVRALRVAAAAAEDRSHLARRVEMLLDSTRHASTRLLWVRLSTATLGIAALAWGAARMPGVLEFARPLGVIERLSESPRVAVAGDVTDDLVPLPKVLVAQAVTPTAPPLPVVPRPTAESAPMVFVPVAVLDPLNRFVTGLGKEVFRVQEDGVDQVVAQLNPEGEQTEIFIVVDPQVGSAADTIGRILGVSQAANAQVFLGGIDQSSLLSGIQLMGQRAHEDANHRKAVLILTGSQANTRSYTQAEFRTALADLASPVYTVEVTDVGGLAATSPGETSQRPILTEIALQTGGALCFRFQRRGSAKRRQQGSHRDAEYVLSGICSVERRAGWGVSKSPGYG